MWRAAMELVVWTAFLLILYVIFISSVTPLELAVGGVASVFGAVGAHTVRRASTAGSGGGARWALAVWSWPCTLLGDTGRLLVLLLRRGHAGTFRVVELAEGTGPAWACALLSATPGSYAVDVGPGGAAGAKAALFGLTGVLLDRHGSVDEHGLHGRARELPLPGVMFALGGLALAGLPPFGTGLGKALAEDAAGHQHRWLPAVFVLVSAVTSGAVLRVALRVFAGAGPEPADRPGEPETSGEGEEPEIRDPSRALPTPMLAVPGVLLLGCLAVGALPAVGRSLAEASRLFTDQAGYARAALELASPPAPAFAPPAEWTGAGVLLGLLSALLACALAAAVVWLPGRLPGRHAAARVNHRLVLPLRRLHSGLLGDYVAWLVVGIAVLIVTVAAQV